MPKAVEKPDPRRAALGLFIESFKKARGIGAKSADVARFREVIGATREAGLTPWREMRDPLEAAADLTLTATAKMVGEALPLLWREQMRDMRAALGYAAAPPLERPLIDHACLCWLRLALMELRYSSLTEDNTLKAVEHTEKRVASAQKRFNRACETLAKVRKLKLPAVQINVAAEGGQQVNVA
jgi:hypothetical protein